MIFVFTGRGKGKTTSAIGQAIRALGQNKRVLIIQFIKGPDFNTGEEKILKKLTSGFSLIQGGKGFVGIMGDKLTKSTHKKAAQETFQKAKKAIFSGKYDLIILDEVNVALSLKLVNLKEFSALLRKVPSQLDLILTGRGAPKQIIKIADLVTDFREIKHYYQRGIKAKKGREY